MTPLRLSHTWHRRLYVAIFLLSASIVAIYVLDYLAIYATPVYLKISTITAIAATLAMVGSGVFFFIEKKLSGFGYSFAVFILLTVAVAWQVAQTGGIGSPYLILWTLLVLASAVFGAYGWLSIIFLIGAYIAGAYLNNTLEIDTILLITLSSVVPLIVGIIVWREQGEIDESTKNVKNLANQLSEVASKSEIVINAIGDGVMAVDPKGIIQLINPAAQQILGWGKQDALMLSYKSILKLEDENAKELDETKDPIQQVLNTNQQLRVKNLMAMTQSGKKISVSMVVTPIGDVGSGVIVVFSDRTNERAEERGQAEFISTASHEMRTPVASIEGYLGLALNPNTATIDARAQDFILKAQGAAQHLGRLFQDLLDVSKTDDGRMANVPRIVDVAALTETIVEGLTQKATDKGLKLKFAPVNDGQLKIMPVYYVNQDKDHIREILDNLVENAIKYTPTGEVVVDIKSDDDKVTISIQDSGLGIPPEDLPHLFQKFYRVSNLDRQEIGGTGLGLYLVRKLAEDIQGRVWVESVYKEGSTFFLELPRVNTQDAERLIQEQKPVETPVSVKTFVPETNPVAPIIPGKSRATAPAPIPMTDPHPPVTPLSEQPVAAPAPVPVFTTTSAPTTAPAPVQAPAPAPAAVVSAPTPTATPIVSPTVKPATTVPRGQTLTREQINERVKQLEELSKQQRETTGR